MLPKKPVFVDSLKDATAVLEDSFLPWLEPQQDVPRDESLHNEVSGLVSYLLLQPHEIQAREMLISYMRTVIQSHWRDARASAFGSTATGLGLPTADIDLVVSFDDFGGRLTEKQIRRRLMDIENDFVRAGIASSVTRVFFARVPIISFTTSHALGGLKVDVSISTEDDAGRRAVPLVKSYIQEMPALRALILCIKMFLSPRGLNNAAQNTLSSYAITLLVVSFLQRNPTGLPAEFLFRPMENKALGVLLRDFFASYSSEFPLATHYVSVSEGGIFPKERKKWKIQATPMLSVECIINPDKDITRGTSKISAVLDAFRFASKMLGSSRIKPGESLLGKVIQVPRSMEESRNLVKTVMNNGAFLRAVTTTSRAPSPYYYQSPPSLLERIGHRRDAYARYENGYDDRRGYHRRDYRNDHQRAGFDQGDRWQIDKDRDPRQVYIPKEHRDDHRQSHHAIQIQTSNVRGRTSTPSRPLRPPNEISGLPRRPPSFDYMRSKERRDR